MSDQINKDLGLAMTGGGARAAYQVIVALGHRSSLEYLLVL